MVVELSPTASISRNGNGIHYGALVRNRGSAVFHDTVHSTMALCGRPIDGFGPRAEWHDFDAGPVLQRHGYRRCFGCATLNGGV